MTEVSDPGNVSALSSEVEKLIEEAKSKLTRETDDRAWEFITEEVLRGLVREALATVEADAASKQIGLNLYEARMQRLEEQARALAEALREVDDHFGREYWTSDDGTTQRHGTPDDNECPRQTGELWRKVRAALASWDTSQKESR